MYFLKRFFYYFDKSKKIQVLKYLQSLPEDQLIEWGFSPSLIRQGISAWPWREEESPEIQTSIEQLAAEEQRSVDELQRYTDRELHDLGLTRGSIRHSVRHGRPGIEKPAENKAA